MINENMRAFIFGALKRGSYILKKSKIIQLLHSLWFHKSRGCRLLSIKLQVRACMLIWSPFVLLFKISAYNQQLFLLL